jgi:hypothetical protein
MPISGMVAALTTTPSFPGVARRGRIVGSARHNRLVAQRVILTASARRKHGVNKRNAIATMRHSSVPTIQPGGSILYVGRDPNGRLTEVAVIEGAEDDRVLVIIHAMPLEW